MEKKRQEREISGRGREEQKIRIFLMSRTRIKEREDLLIPTAPTYVWIFCENLGKRGKSEGQENVFFKLFKQHHLHVSLSNRFFLTYLIYIFFKIIYALFELKCNFRALIL